MKWRIKVFLLHIQYKRLLYQKIYYKFQNSKLTPSFIYELLFLPFWNAQIWNRCPSFCLIHPLTCAIVVCNHRIQRVPEVMLISYAKMSANQCSGCLHWSLTADTPFQWSIQIIYVYINYDCFDEKKKCTSGNIQLFKKGLSWTFWKVGLV